MDITVVLVARQPSFTLTDLVIIIVLVANIHSAAKLHVN